ncbi:MAG: hypothetical protein KKA19_05825 [Candidatus Margulisbacteria bacterium]|nr:hypothetical protein [Candidatus Margulisiibacteriota bacterium]
MNLQAILNMIWTPIQDMVLGLWSYVPTLLGALLVLVIGAWIAKVLRDVLISILEFVRIDDLADAIGLTNALKTGSVNSPLSVLIPVIAFWATMLGVLYSSFNILGIAMLDKAAKLLLGFIPNVMTAVFVFIVGATIAVFVSAVARIVSSLFDYTNDDLIAGFVGYAVNIYAIIIGLQYLRLGIDVVNNVLVIAIIAAALAIALGVQGWAGNAVKAILTAKPKVSNVGGKKKKR